MNLLISACLLGICCRYDGQAKPLPDLKHLTKRHHLVPICPEILGGLPTLRPPAERCGSRVITRQGDDVTAFYQRGAQQALLIARLTDCTCALLKERSPSCGYGRIYDGSFSGTLISGKGVAAEFLEQNGLCVLGESQLDRLC